ncbi:MAG: long-chain fatty acid--CoA ligase [Deltaproteobacteria bacterium]|nr:long-chain fatty acid--CoA ligase [Deltaproteobacteria bacterium]
MTGTILQIFKANVKNLGSKTCFRFKDGASWKKISWKESLNLVEAYAAGLIALNLKKGDRIAILSSTRVEWTLCDLASLLASLVVVPIYHSMNAEQIAYILNETETKAVFVENEELLAKVGFVLGGIQSLKNIVLFGTSGVPAPDRKFLTLEDLKALGRGKALVEENSAGAATIIYTSGTTGTPKGVIISHDNIMAEVNALIKIFRLGPDETMLSFLPLAHVLARAAQFFQLAMGCQAAYAVSLIELQKNFTEIRPQMTVVVPRFIEKIYEKVKTTAGKSPLKMKIFEWGSAVGIEYSRLARRKERISMFLRLQYAAAKIVFFSKLHKALGGRIRFIISGGAPLSAELSKFFHGAGLLILEGYGLTETFAAVTVNREDDFHLGTVGKPLEGVDIKLSNDNEIFIKGGVVFKEYYKSPEGTAEAFDQDGWFKSGDIGEFSRDGFLRITGRKKDLIITAGGKNVAPHAIEALIEESPYISHAVVFGDRRKFISALVSLNIETIGQYAREHNFQFNAPEELPDHPEIKKLISSVMEDKNRKLSHFESVKKFAILKNDFSIEDGELTPTMKIRRRYVEKKYKEVIDKLYEEI